MTKIKELTPNDRPIERLLNCGSEALSNDELLAIILRTGTKEISSKELALNLLSKFSLEELINVRYEELVKIKGIGLKKASLLLACLELSKRINQKQKVISGIKVNDPVIIFDYYYEFFKNKKQEYFYAIYLDIKNKIIKDKLLFIGTLNYSLVNPREIFKEAFLIEATGIIIVHNHPSGDETPSINDYDTTSRLIEVGNLLGIKILDHIIIGSKYYSFKENGDI